MATTVPIASAVLPVGPTVVATVLPVAVWSTFTLSLDRTVANGMDATPATSVAVTIERSTDNGATWLPEMSGGAIPGGPVSENGARLTTDVVTVHNGAPVPGRVRVTLTVAGAPVTMGSGSAQVA